MSESVNYKGDHVECLQCTCTPTKPKRPTQNYDERSGVRNWEKWVAIRKRVHQHLAQTVHRQPGDLLMNLGEQFRQIQEEKLALEYSKINTNFDKYRGNPEFWTLPVGLVDKCDRSLNPTYFAVKTKVQRNEVPFIKHVVTPSYVLVEQNIFPFKRNISGSHRCEASRDLSPEVNQVNARRREYDNLIVIGEKLTASKKQDVGLTEDPGQLTSIKDQAVVESDNEEMPTIPKTHFLINGITFSTYNEFGNGVTEIYLTFDDSLLDRPKVRRIKFENRGALAIRFHWSQLKKFLLFRDFIESHREESHAFSFNKNELLLPPDTAIDFPIWFDSKKIGNYFETWEITTKPEMWDCNFKLIIILHGYVYPEDFNNKTKHIRETLCKRIDSTIIKDIINATMQKLKFRTTSKRVFEFTEKTLFESANMETWMGEKRPKYLYNKKIVDELKLLFKKMRFAHSPKVWNFSVPQLKKKARRRDIWVYVENDTKQMLKSKQRRIELNNFVEDVVLISQVEKKSITISSVESYTVQIESLLQKLKGPVMIPNKNRVKHFVAYVVIRTSLYKIFDALEKYDNLVGATTDDCSPQYNYKAVRSIEQLPERLLFERYEDIWVNRTKRNPAPNKKIEFVPFPKAERLKDIPREDTKLIHKTYFNTTQDEREGKVEAKNKKSKSISEEIDFKTVRSRSREVSNQIKGSLVKHNFDPYLEEFMLPKYSTTQVACPKTTSCDIDVIDYQKYVIVYSILVEAVESMVDALETLNVPDTNTELLRELTRCRNQIDDDIVIDAPEMSPLEEDEYFKNLLDSHLTQNPSVQKYIVEGKIKVLDHVIPTDIKSIESESMTTLFKSQESVKMDKSKLSVEVQTSKVSDEELNALANALKWDSSSEIELEPSVHSEEVPEDYVFYVIQDEDNNVETKKQSF